LSDRNKNKTFTPTSYFFREKCASLRKHIPLYFHLYAHCDYGGVAIVNIEGDSKVLSRTVGSYHKCISITEKEEKRNATFVYSFIVKWDISHVKEYLLTRDKRLSNVSLSFYNRRNCTFTWRLLSFSHVNMIIPFRE